MCSLIVGVDFDGTVVKYNFPGIGESVGAEQTLLNLNANGHRIILYTVRSKMMSAWNHYSGIPFEAGDYLTPAIEWFEERGIKLWAVNENLIQKAFSISPKPHFDILIDDNALGCPLVNEYGQRPYVDWKIVRQYFIKHGFI